MKENLIHYRTCVCNINYHMVWSVKYRRKILSPEVEEYLQELVQQKKNQVLAYELVGQSGPDHDKHFVVAVRFNSDKVARGEGRSKKMAEQHAAREALKLLGVIKEK